MKARTVYELNFKTHMGWYNLLFGTKKRAEKDLKGRFAVGSNWVADEIIESAFISERSLF